MTIVNTRYGRLRDEVIRGILNTINNQYNTHNTYTATEASISYCAVTIVITIGID